MNAHSYKRDKKAGVRLREDGEVELRGSGRADYYHPKSVRECHNAIMNWRSAMARLWPWSWEAEVFVKLMEDYGYLQVLERMIVIRIVINVCFSLPRVRACRCASGS